MAVRLEIVEVAFLSPHVVGLGLVTISLATYLADGGTCLPAAVVATTLGPLKDSLGQTSGTLVVVLVWVLVLVVSFSYADSSLCSANSSE